MPIKVNNAVTAGGRSTESPFVGPVDHTVGIVVPITGLTAFEVDKNGRLKPGIPLTRAGGLVGAGVAVYGCTVGTPKVAKSNAAADIAAAGSMEVAVALIGTVNRAILEDSLGRVLTANEIAGFALAGSLLKLLA
jgi:hypothetical protein